MPITKEKGKGNEPSPLFLAGAWAVLWLDFLVMNTLWRSSCFVMVGLSLFLSAGYPSFAEDGPNGVLAAQTQVRPKPKYGPDAVPLSVSSEYFRKHDAPVFWAMIPYYQAQETGSGCSVAAVAMLMNGLRAGQSLKADDELVTQKGLLRKVRDRAWTWSTSAVGHGRSLDQLGPLVEASLKAYGITGATVEVVHLETDTAGAGRKKLHEALVGLEKSRRHWLLANFLQGSYTGDADVGHFAPISAYDSDKNRALVMDPDRKWYEPYWVSEETLAKGMATLDSGPGKNRGFIWIRLPETR